MGVCVTQDQNDKDLAKLMMISEYLEGGSLYKLLHPKESEDMREFQSLHVKKRMHIPKQEVIPIIEDIALGMRYLHQCKVYHCDLKSQNILIDDDWNLHLCDFGLSNFWQRKENRSRYVGTPNWMAPEILKGEDYDAKSDVYSFGLICWEIITKQIPHYGLSFAQIQGYVAYHKKSVEIPKKGNPVVLNVIRQCLQYEREDRPNFAEICEMLNTKNEAKEERKHVIKQLDYFFN